MARGKIEIVRSEMDAMTRGDPRARYGLAHADYEFQTTSALPNAGMYRGLVAVFSREFDDTWEMFLIEEEQVSDTEDTVVILGRVKARGKASGVALESSIAYLHAPRGSKLARTQVFFDHSGAIEAAGLARRV